MDNFSFISSNSSNITSVRITCSADMYLCLMLVAILILPFHICGLLHGFKTMITNKDYKSPDVLNLSMIITAVLTTMPMIFIYIFFYTSTFLFSIASVFAFACFQAQAQFQAWICLEQYVAVIHPMFYLKVKQYRYGLVLASFTWLTSIAFTVLVMILGFNKSIFLFLTLTSVFLVVILFCSVATLTALKHPSPGGGKGKDMHLKKIKAFKIITSNLVVLIIRFYPIIGVTFLFELLPPKILCLASLITLSFLLLGSVYNSLLFISRFVKMPHTVARNVLITHE